MERVDHARDHHILTTGTTALVPTTRSCMMFVYWHGDLGPPIVARDRVRPACQVDNRESSRSRPSQYLRINETTKTLRVLHLGPPIVARWHANTEDSGDADEVGFTACITGP